MLTSTNLEIYFYLITVVDLIGSPGYYISMFENVFLLV